MKKYWPFIFRLIFVALLIIIMAPIYSVFSGTLYAYRHAAMRSMTVLQIMMVLLIIYHLVQSVIFILIQRSDPSPALVRFHSLGAGGLVKQYYTSQLSSVFKKKIWFVVWGACIFSFVLLNYFSEIYSGYEDVFLKNGRIEMIYMDDFRDYFVVDANSSNSHIEVVGFFTEDNNPVRYISDMITIAKDVHEAGAKVVVIDLPGRIFPITQKRLHALDSLLNILQSLPYVTFAGDYWFYQNPIANNNLSPYTVKKMEPYSLYHRSDLVRYYPYKNRTDIALAAARKYFGIADSVRPMKEDGEIILGSIRIPVNRSGVAFSDNTFVLHGLNIHYSAFRGFDESEHGTDERVLYTEDPASIGMHIQGRKSPIENLKNAKEVFDGKVVLIAWNYSEHHFTKPLFTQSVASSIVNIIENKHYTHSGTITIGLTIFAVILIGAVSFRYGSLVTFLTGTLLSLSIIGGCVTAFLKMHLIIEVLYPITAALLSMIIFPLLKISFYTRN